MAVNYTSLYNRLATKVNKLRKRLLRKRRQYEREDEEMRLKGRYPRPRPDFEVPMKQRLLEPSATQLSKEAYQAYKAQVQASYGGISGNLEDFYKLAYKQNYLDTLTGQGFMEVSPKGRFFTKEEMENADPELRDKMQLYNMIYFMPIAEFMWNYERGYILKLGFIYQGLTDTKAPSFAEEQRVFLSLAKKERLHLTSRQIKRGKKLLKVNNRPVKLNQYSAEGRYFDKHGKIK